MQVNVRPLSGCTTVLLGVFTLGIAPLSIWLKERSWPKELNEQGLLTRGGKFIAWSEFTKVRKVVTRVGGGVTTERYDLHSPKGKVSIVPDRIDDARAVLEYVWDHLPASVRAGAVEGR